MKKEKVWYEEFKVEGEKLLSKSKELIHEGNIRRLIIKNEKGKTLLEVPLTIGVVVGGSISTLTGGHQRHSCPRNPLYNRS